MNRWVVFMHVPKTAGNSISHAVKHKLKDDYFVNGGHRNFEQMIDMWCHKKYPMERWHNAFKFGFVRNPWDRYIAFYLYHTGRPSRTDVPTPEGFQAWMEKPNSLITDCVPKLCFSYCGMDFIGRFEHLDEDMIRLGELLGHDYSAPIAVLNPTFPKSKEQPREHDYWYDRATADMVYELGRWEIEHFGYHYRYED